MTWATDEALTGCEDLIEEVWEDVPGADISAQVDALESCEAGAVREATAQLEAILAEKEWADLRRFLGSKAVGQYIAAIGGWAPMDEEGRVALSVSFHQPSWEECEEYKPATLTPDPRPTDGVLDTRLLVEVHSAGRRVASYYAGRDRRIETRPGVSR